MPIHLTVFLLFPETLLWFTFPHFFQVSTQISFFQKYILIFLSESVLSHHNYKSVWNLWNQPCFSFAYKSTCTLMSPNRIVLSLSFPYSILFFLPATTVTWNFSVSNTYIQKYIHIYTLNMLYRYCFLFAGSLFLPLDYKFFDGKGLCIICLPQPPCGRNCL